MNRRNKDNGKQLKQENGAQKLLIKKEEEAQKR